MKMSVGCGCSGILRRDEESSEALDEQWICSFFFGNNGANVREGFTNGLPWISYVALFAVN